MNIHCDNWMQRSIYIKKNKEKYNGMYMFQGDNESVGCTTQVAYLIYTLGWSEFERKLRDCPICKLY